jgi:outer membrane protein assembly factor BamB
VLLGERSVAGYDPADGRRLWSAEWPSSGENVTQPVAVGEDGLLVSSGYGIGAALLRLAPVPGSDPPELAAERAWTSRHLKSKFGDVIVFEGYAYGLDDGVLACVDLADGSREWKEDRLGHGQIIGVDYTLLIAAEDGTVELRLASPWSSTPRFWAFQALDGKTWNPPAFAAPYLLVRNDVEAACWELPLEAP